MKKVTLLTRRQAIKGAVAVGLLSTIGDLVPLPEAKAAKKISMGFIYVGSRDDYGYNQSPF